MKIDRYEKAVLALTVVVEAAFLVAIFIAVTRYGIVLPAPTQRVDPRTVASTAPWNQPGLTQVGPGEYEVIMRAQAKSWQFEPAEVKVPVGAKVTFRIVSEDVIHGFRMTNTNLNAMIIPGEVTLVQHEFKTPGEYVYLCHEYCGLGHQAMFGKVIVGETQASAAQTSMKPAGGDKEPSK